jgi:hypothetical protein
MGGSLHNVEVPGLVQHCPVCPSVVAAFQVTRRSLFRSVETANLDLTEPR